jgi:hypothetical protein
MREWKIERIVALGEVIRKPGNQAVVEALGRKKVGQTTVCPTPCCFDLKKTRNTRK